MTTNSAQFYNPATGVYNIKQALGMPLPTDTDIAGVFKPATVGTAGRDLLQSTAVGQSLLGNGGDDIIGVTHSGVVANGGDGNDLLTSGTTGALIGGAGNDILVGLYKNVLTGGTGNDIFSINLGAKVKVTDFTAGDQLVISASQCGLKHKTTGGQFRMGSKAQTSSDRLIYNSNTGKLLSDIDGVGGKGASVLATFTPGTRLNSGSFTVI